MPSFLTDLVREEGQQAAANLASAYEATLLAVSNEGVGGVPDRATRLRYLQAMLAEGRRNGFATGRLTDAALAEDRHLRRPDGASGI